MTENGEDKMAASKKLDDEEFNCIRQLQNARLRTRCLANVYAILISNAKNCCYCLQMRKLRVSCVRQRMRHRSQPRDRVRRPHVRQGQNRRGGSDGAGSHLLADFRTTHPAPLRPQSQGLGHCPANALSSVRALPTYIFCYVHSCIYM